MLEVQRLEAESARKFAEKARRMAQEKERKRLQAELKEKVAARSFARTYLAEMNATVFSDLEKEGAFFDPVKKEVQDVFLPWLFDGVAAEANSVATAHRVADDLIRSALSAAATLHAEAKQAEENARVEREAKEAEQTPALKETV